MPKSRKRKHERSSKERKRRSTAYLVQKMAANLPNQAALDACLLQEPDPIRRKQLFNFMKRFIKFFDPQFPSVLDRPSGIIRP